MTVAMPAPAGAPGMSSGNFYDSLDRHFATFDVKITDHSAQAYLSAFTCAEARRRKGVVYLFRAEREVPRLVGTSDILYIGQTKHSFRRRYEQGRLVFVSYAPPITPRVARQAAPILALRRHS